MLSGKKRRIMHTVESAMLCDNIMHHCLCIGRRDIAVALLKQSYRRIIINVIVAIQKGIIDVEYPWHKPNDRAADGRNGIIVQMPQIRMMRSKRRIADYANGTRFTSRMSRENARSLRPISKIHR